MPTMARLVAAILMAALGWGAAALAVRYAPDGVPTGLVAPVSALWGLVLGWVWTGGRLQAGAGKPLGYGFMGAVLLVFWVVLSFALVEMIQRALHIRYHGEPMAALEDMMAISIDYLRLVAHGDVLAVLALGGLAIGAITGWAARRFR